MTATATACDKKQTCLKILVVDDNVDAAESLCMLLKLLGHETAAAYDGITGLALAQEFHPGVALIDIGLPKLNGYELARQLREAPAAPSMIVAVSGYGQDEDRRKSREAGIDHHLTKPVDLALLQSVLAQVK